MHNFNMHNFNIHNFNDIRKNIRKGSWLGWIGLVILWISITYFPRHEKIVEASNIQQPPTTINNVPLSSSLSLAKLPLTQTYTAGAGGTTAGLLVVLDASNPSLVITAPTTSVAVIGIAMSTVLAGANVEVALNGVTTCIADNTTIAGAILVPGVATAGRCRNNATAQQTLSTVTQIIGYALNVATVGNPVTIKLAGSGFYGGGNLQNAVATDVLFGGGATGTIAIDSVFTYTSGQHLLSSQAYGTATNCTSSASPAVCGSAAAGSIAIPVGTNQTLVVDTSAVTANSNIFLQSDDTLGTKLGITCNSTAATIALPIAISSRSNNTSFTALLTGVSSTNKVCFNYFIID